MKVARSVFLLFLAVLGMYVIRMLVEIPTPPDWNGIKTYFVNNPVLVVILALPMIYIGFILLAIRKIDIWEDDKTVERHKELLEAIKNNRPLIFRGSSYGTRKYKRNL